MAVSEWLESRTGLVSASRRFFSEEIPASVGWPHVFGSVALFILLVQATTGVLLALNFAAVPGDAYDSVSYLMHEVTGGRIIRGLHHWGASAMVVVVGVHALQVFLYGAYRRPREVTWLAGIALLITVLAFGLTGYLLPWDNRAYWGTVVTTQIAGQTPFAGQWLQRFLGAANGVGVVTFSRFYTLHVAVLPVATVLLTGLHLALVRRHGAVGSRAGEIRTQTFFPGQVLKDTLAIVVVFGLLLAAALFLEVPLEGAADPANTSYVPRPEWYFLALFQLLKFFGGRLEPLASVGLPGLAVGALVLLPFVDRSAHRGLRQRWWAAVIGAGVIAGWSALTMLALADGHAKPASANTQENVDARLFAIPADELAGFLVYREENCGSCHNLVNGTPKQGPTLATLTERRPAAWVESHVRGIPEFGQRRLSPAEAAALAQFAAKLDPLKATLLQTAPAAVLEGAAVYTRNLCQSCHRVNGSGGQIGPMLNGVSGRRSRNWVERHFAEPRALSPRTVMPPYHFGPDEENRLVDYLFSLP